MSLFGKPRINMLSIKESFDNLPSGICFANKKGIIVLCNRQMHRLCHTLLGTDLQNLFELQNGLKNPKDRVQTIDADAFVFRFPDGEVRQFARCEITDECGITYTQIQAVIVTELYEKQTELQQENEALQKANARAKLLYAMLDEIVRDEENFAVKTHVHSEMGTELGITHKLLQSDCTLDELRLAGKRWERIASTLGMAGANGGEENTNAPDKAIAALVDTIAGIGVTVAISGSLPKSAQVCSLLLVAIRECAINTVSHAKGNQMTVELTETKNTVTAAITNNGIAPKKKIMEGGGLGSLRRRIERAGGTMTVNSTPFYRLEITLPGEGETE